MDFSKAKVIFVTDAKQRMYFTGFFSTAGYVVLTESETAFVVDSRYFYAAQEKLEAKKRARPSSASIIQKRP